MGPDSRFFHCRTPTEPSDRWRLFAIAAQKRSEGREVELYATRLRARRATTHMYRLDRDFAGK
jgi:hypothetical protein